MDHTLEEVLYRGLSDCDEFVPTLGDVVARGARIRRRTVATRGAAVAACLVFIVVVGLLVGNRPEGAVVAATGQPLTSGVLETLPTWPGEMGPLALLTGTIVMEADGCLYLHGVQGERGLAVWPGGTSVDDTGGSFSVTLKNGATVTSEDPVIAEAAGAWSDYYPGGAPPYEEFPDCEFGRYAVITGIE